MATYTISIETNRGFDVKIVGNDGTRQTLLGFPTRQAAEAWIAEDRKRSGEEVPAGC
jgi:hypothetical protein